GYAPGSSWSRGHAWAVYGFALNYAHTKNQAYLDTAKKIAHYFIANVSGTGFLPLVDFRAPAEPVIFDSTAGVCAACGMLEIAEHVGEFEKPLYINAAVNILKATEKKFCNWDIDFDSIVGNGVASYHGRSGDFEVPIIYGDYFFIEGILRLLEKDFLIW
ncbi:MAG TPA: glycosyl hydrolase family 88, partial [Oscillospiraceae bacterium]|nr:glycosyl hydrolase family 88 [Oscillospiraceae bacterium]